MNIESFRSDASIRAQKRIASRIKNNSSVLTKELINAMIRNTRNTEEIYIYTDTLPQEIYRPLLDSQAKRVHILLDRATELNWLLQAEHRPELDVKIIQSPRINHFFCTSGGFFQFRKDKSKCEEDANFNDLETCQALISAFDRYQTSAIKVV
jgi:hypothetical protein